MSIPKSERVVFTRNPLKQVICQLQFPTILRIDSELPADFQDAIRSEYPILRERSEQPNFPIPEEISQLLPPELKAGGRTVYDFISTDEKWVISLAHNFLALTTGDYERWEDFRAHFEGPLTALLDTYKPAFFSRIGLRYQNIINRAELRLGDVQWKELLKPYIAGILSPASGLSENLVLEFKHNELIKIDKERKFLVRMLYGLMKEEHSQEWLFLIDNDFFTSERVETDVVNSALGYLHDQSGHLFQWCISERLRNALEPRTI